MENLIEELTKVNPANLSEEGLKLFNTINEIIDRNKYLEARNDRINEQNIKYTETLEKLQKETVWKAKVEEEFEKEMTHNNCFNLGDMQELLDRILE